MNSHILVGAGNRMPPFIMRIEMWPNRRIAAPDNSRLRGGADKPVVHAHGARGSQDKPPAGTAAMPRTPLRYTATPPHRYSAANRRRQGRLRRYCPILLQTSTHSAHREYRSSSSMVSSMALLLLPHAGKTVPNLRRDSSR